MKTHSSSSLHAIAIALSIASSPLSAAPLTNSHVSLTNQNASQAEFKLEDMKAFTFLPYGPNTAVYEAVNAHSPSTQTKFLAFCRFEYAPTIYFRGLRSHIESVFYFEQYATKTTVLPTLNVLIELEPHNPKQKPDLSLVRHVIYWMAGSSNAFVRSEEGFSFNPNEFKEKLETITKYCPW